ncbi:hypothetical protein D3C87_1979500 [compost metagenome]
MFKLPVIIQLLQTVITCCHRIEIGKVIKLIIFCIAASVHKTNLLKRPRIGAAFDFEAFVAGFGSSFPGEFGLVGFGFASKVN